MFGHYQRKEKDPPLLIYNMIIDQTRVVSITRIASAAALGR